MEPQGDPQGNLPLDPRHASAVKGGYLEGRESAANPCVQVLAFRDVYHPRLAGASYHCP